MPPYEFRYSSPTSSFTVQKEVGQLVRDSIYSKIRIQGDFVVLLARKQVVDTDMLHFLLFRLSMPQKTNLICRISQQCVVDAQDLVFSTIIRAIRVPFDDYIENEEIEEIIDMLFAYGVKNDFSDKSQ
ncbi:hypothetical protein SS50377_21772 [Spironucleus salmonicida]|uniref:Uncharacterized protein n=1 Tax=Spironucleus salmonicida TaxID=348837 RepID=A0A9P8LXL3_9EUKA|nr:hypothetical protein SS50377_21772 [Spironucleus salmonicida]